MASEAVSTRSVIRVRGEAATVDDDLVVEEPVEFRLDGTALAVVMRTPGNDAELALGFAITEGIVNGPDEVASVVDLAASIKVAAIIVFILIAAGWLLGIGGGDSPGLTNLTADGGFAPEGVLTLFSGIAIVIFAFVGAEIVTIAAAESEQPEEAVAQAVRSVVYRVMLFYVLSIFLLVCIVPWTQVPVGESPFIGALDRIGIPGAADVMNAIIVTAVLSCLNSGLYTGSRMLFALARRGDAPKGLLEVNARGVPVKAILLTTAIGFLSTIIAWLSPETVFLFLVNSSGAIALFVYLLIAVAQLRMRRRLEQESPEKLKVKMWLYPWLTWFSIVAIVAIVASMAFVDDEATRSYLIPSLISLAVVVAAAFIRGRRERGPRTAREPAGAARSGAA